MRSTLQAENMDLSPSRQDRHSRRGMSLAELLVAMATSLVLLGVLAQITAALSQYRDRNENASAQRLGVARLADQFRADVRRAHRVRGGQEDSDAVEIQFPGGGRAQYRLADRHVTRELFCTAGPPTARDRFAMREGTRLSLQLSGGPPAPMAELVLDSPIHAAPDSKRRRLSIVAAIGRDLRWVNDEQGEQ